jgi:hypothetical protein
MARSGNFQITGNELQAMVNENLLGLKAGQSIPATNRCLTRQEVANRVHVYTGDSPDGSFIPNSSYQIGNTFFTGPSPNLTCNWNYLNPLRAFSILFEQNQEGNPYLNSELYGSVNGSPLRLDPNNGLDGMFFGGPQYSPQMNAVVRVGNSVNVQANFGLNNPENGVDWGWNAPGFGFLEVYANGSLISNQNVFKNAASSPNAQNLNFTFIAQANTDYYIKAYTLVTYEYYMCYSSVSSNDACSSAFNGTNGCECCTQGGSGTC